MRRALRQRIMVSYALCSLAEGEIHQGDLQRAHQTVKAIRGLMGEVSLLISGPETASPSVIREAGEMLAELEERVITIEQSLP